MVRMASFFAVNATCVNVMSDAVIAVASLG